MADEELEVTFTLENEPLNAEYELNPNEEIDADFLINASGTTWGSISGTLSNQTDLQAALDLKADKSEVESVTGALADSIQAVDNKYDSITSGLDDSITAIDNKYDSITGALDDKIDSINGALSDSIDALESVVSANYNTLSDSISAEITNRQNADSIIGDSITALDNKYDSITGGLSDSISAIDSTIGGYGDIVTYNAADFATSIQGGKADTALQPNDNISELNNDVGYITSASLPTVNDSTITIQKNGTTVESFTLNQTTNETVNITVPTTAADVNALPDTTTINDLTTSTQQAALNSGANTTNIGQIATNTQDISDEIINRQNADNGLQSQIDALVVASDVFDIVGTYAELQAYDIATVPVNDIIKVLVDSTHNDAATYYRCILSGGVKSWSYIGSEGAYYTKGEADGLFVPQTRTVNGYALSNNITLNASDVGALSDSTVIPTVNNSTITIQKNSSTVDTFTLNQATAKTINITVPTDTNDLTNGAGYITASSIPTDYYTKSEIDAILPQPTKVPIVYYQPTDSYCYTESNNRFYGSHVFEKLYLVQPKTSGTTQVIDMSTTFSLDFSFKYLGAPATTFTLAEIMVSSASGKGVLLQVNSGGMYYRNNITSSTVTGTRSLVVGNTYDVRVEYNGTKMVISWKLSSDANYTEINATTCTVSGTYYNYASIGSDGDSIYLPLSSVVLVNDGTTLYDYVAGKIALDYDETLTLDSNQLSVVVDQTFDGTSANPQSGVAIAGAGFITSADLPTNYVTTDTVQNITAEKTFVGNKLLKFKGVNGTSKLGFTAYDSSNREVGYLEAQGQGNASHKCRLGVYDTNTSNYDNILGFEYYKGKGSDGSLHRYSLICPPLYPSTTDANFYIPMAITDGNTAVTADNTGSVNISSLIPTSDIFVAEYDVTSYSDVLAAYNAGKYIYVKNGDVYFYLESSSLYGFKFVSPFSETTSSGIGGIILRTDNTWSTNGNHLLQDKLSAGSNITISGDTISATDTTYSDFTGADSITAGTSGLVPAPSAGDDDKILTGGATWSALKTINNTNILGSGNIDTNKVFIAEYGITTSSQIRTAMDNGKILACKKIIPIDSDDNEQYYYSYIGEDYSIDNQHVSYVFSGINQNKVETVYIINYLDTWHSVTTNFVNKSGDTMTGALTVQMSSPKIYLSNSDLTKGTNPASTKYIGLSFNDNTNSTTWQDTRLFNVEGALESNGTTHFYLQALKNEAGATESATFNLYMTQAGVASCSFPQTDCVDGQWKNVDQQIISSTTSLNGSTNLTYRVDLPNDGQKYEVMIRGMGYTGSTAGNEIYITVIGNEDGGSRYLCRARAAVSGTFVAAGTVIATCSYVSSTGKNLTVSRNSSWNGSCTELRVIAYRRIGTNT